MAEKPEDNQQGRASVIVAGSALKDWFVREVLPLESALMQYLQHSCRDKHEIADLRQEVYVRVYEAAREQIPRPRGRSCSPRRAIFSSIACGANTSFRSNPSSISKRWTCHRQAGAGSRVIARDELRRCSKRIERLPARCREAVMLGRSKGFRGGKSRGAWASRKRRSPASGASA